MGCGSTRQSDLAVENWRQKREQKRQKSTSSTTKSFDDEDNSSKNDYTLKNVSVSPSSNNITTTLKQNDNTTNSVNKLSVISQQQNADQLQQRPSKSPSPRPKGPAKIRELFIEKPVNVRGFGFKLNGGNNRPVYISSLEDGSPADKCGLNIDDEVLYMNDENVEQMTFDQVRKLLKDRILKGTIKLVVRTYEEIFDENTQNVIAQHHSRTPSPQKSLSTTPFPSSSSNMKTVINSTQRSLNESSNSNNKFIPNNIEKLSSSKLNNDLNNPITINNNIKSPSSDFSSPVLNSPTTPLTMSQPTSPVYTFLPYTPLTASDVPPQTMVPITPNRTSSLNIFAPKPFRSSNTVDTMNTDGTVC
ncbi:unnamed protein product [Didymodactylos carnosus]|uniref:PDZ domain-containing protein n=1 Tax=Didymodactylos carnosus TaxID=1234261 RepID=A0A8S2HAN6_9BILA|nr:unnamed protein product [Didymodactylos carnosus]CAF3622380.1 unnamed protein product [Didymodactylos carnosus]